MMFIANYIRARLACFIYPSLMPALEECTRRNLAGYFKEQDDRQRQFSAFVTEHQDYMRDAVREMAATQGHHQEHMKALDDIALAIKGVGIDVRSK